MVGRLTGRISGRHVRIFVALALVVGASVLFWASRDYAVIAPNWDGQVRGVSYDPSHEFTERDAKWVAPEQIDRDMAELSQVTGHIRTYTVAHGLDRVPEIARRHGLTVSLGCWIGPNPDENEKEITLCIRTALNNRRTIDRVFVGNESIMFGYVSPDQLGAYIKRVREALPNRIKVTTAETWATWLMYPEVGKYVDVVAVHLLPYWEGISIHDALNFDARQMVKMEEEFPDKPIIIGESGWPSEGRTRRYAEPSLANEAYYVRSFVQFAMQKGWDYYIIEGFDQPWKAGSEGAVGAYWGLFDAEGHPKFAFAGMLRNFPEWRTYASGAAILSLLLGLLILIRMPRVRQPGYILMGALVALVTTGLLIVIDAITLEYIEPSDLIIILAMVPLVLLAATVILTEGIELVASLWRVERRAVPAAIPEMAARVSIHVPTYNEPPEMVIKTLDALARLDYENFEVILLDNNTPDPNVWLPVEAHCARLGPRFRFVHMDGVKGFKAGALNEALKLTDPAAEFIAVIDSDYQVEPFWLRCALPYFASADVALVQGPQDYRDAAESTFKAMCYEEYRGFFHIGMVERNEHNAIIQHGTMTIVRGSALEQVGGWSTWCITEDTELGLKLFEAGYSAAYIPQSLGKGLTPDTLGAFMTQRYRWVYGAMQIMKRHAGAIFFGRRKLQWAQRYHFLSGWLPWISDGLGFLVTIFALVWSLLMALEPRHFEVPMAALSATALALFVAKMAKTLLLYPKKVGSGVRGAMYASTAGLALTHTVAKAVWAGVFTSNKPFLRTPKCEDAAALGQALRLAWQECTLLILGALAIAATFTTRGWDDPAAVLWMGMLAVQCMPYLATVITAAMSALSNMRAKVIVLPAPQPKPVLPKPA
ncbi:MAG TPA: glycosyltransferase family 2 protein [Rhizomicrobium sp.]|jgi:cellulose synthase/poly-beta-1,6-N-acetylglucosamine synthase-like glycosyltransferase/exo-beta-1,3-glucanase (GH17 family)